MAVYMTVADLNEMTRDHGWSAEYATGFRDRLVSRQRVRYRKARATIEACCSPAGYGRAGRILPGTFRAREDASAPWRPIYSGNDVLAFLATVADGPN